MIHIGRDVRDLNVDKSKYVDPQEELKNHSIFELPTPSLCPNMNIPEYHSRVQQWYVLLTPIDVLITWYASYAA